MLHHAITGNNPPECKCHGSACPNEKGSLHSRRPIDENGLSLNLATPIEKLQELKSAACPILNIFARIGIIRRAKTDPNIDEDFAGFLQVVHDNIWYFLERAHVRILVSIMESFADHHVTCGAGTAACTFIRMERLARMVSREKDDLKKLNHGIIEGMRPTCCTAPDTAINTYRRLHSILFWHPLLWLVFYRILEFDMEAEDHTFNRCDHLEYYRVFGFPKSSMVDFARRYLQPSTVDSKYLDLYRTHHLENSYGGATNFPDRDANFLISNGCTDIIDFGCGQGGRNNGFFTWTKYDPCFHKYSKFPRRSFPGLISYDVLEHVPEGELPVIAEWLELLATKCMVLGISTRPAMAERGMLGNGENAHCTVRNAEWWFTTMRVLLPQFEMVRSFPSKNYAILHLKRLPNEEAASSS